MGLDASQRLGSQQLAGVKVNPRGMAKRVSRNQAGGPLGAAAAKIMFAGASSAPAQTPSFGRNAFLAVTADELALIVLKSGLVTMKLDEVVARVPRQDVTSAELGGGIAPPLTINFRDGESWQVEIVRPSKKQAEAVIHELGA